MSYTNSIYAILFTDTAYNYTLTAGPDEALTWMPDKSSLTQFSIISKNIGKNVGEFRFLSIGR
ncbi:hypothetical protein [Megasphaera elsdenii]|uniref:hypothetical protein n=1 Tax=Megasphaera elsdenii TaxID=907 RepID=UPI003B985DC8